MVGLSRNSLEERPKDLEKKSPTLGKFKLRRKAIEDKVYLIMIIPKKGS